MTNGDNGRREDVDGDKTISNGDGDNNRIKVNEEEEKNEQVKYYVAQFGL